MENIKVKMLIFFFFFFLVKNCILGNEFKIIIEVIIMPKKYIMNTLQYSNYYKLLKG